MHIYMVKANRFLAMNLEENKFGSSCFIDMSRELTESDKKLLSIILEETRIYESWRSFEELVQKALDTLEERVWGISGYVCPMPVEGTIEF